MTINMSAATKALGLLLLDIQRPLVLRRHDRPRLTRGSRLPQRTARCLLAPAREFVIHELQLLLERRAADIVTEHAFELRLPVGVPLPNAIGQTAVAARPPIMPTSRTIVPNATTESRRIER